MRIEKNLPQFKNQRSLIVVSGRQEAILYLVENGKIWEKQKIQVEDPGYTDKEGFFKTSTKLEGTMKAGSIYKENISYHLTKEFLNKFQEEVKNILVKSKEKGIYLFCPDYMKKEVLKKIPKNFKGMVYMTKLGNYTNSHPFDLLESIREDQEKEKNKVATPIKEKALKILKKPYGFIKKGKQ